MPDARSIVISGLGPVCSIGIGREAFFAGLAEGRNGIGEITLFDAGGRSATTAGEVQDFYIEDYLQSQKTYLDRCSEFALAGCTLALQDAGFTESGARVGVSLGTAFGCLDTMRIFLDRLMEKGPRLANPLLFSHSYANTPASLAAIEFSLCGFNATCCTGMSSGGTALAWALDALRLGRADAILAGGMDALSETMYEGCLSQEDCPVLGEGAGIILLETAESAARRGATVYAELAGYGIAGQLIPAIWACLEDSGLQPKDVDLAVAASNGLVSVHVAERQALMELYGHEGIPVIPIKDYIGETFGAAAGLSVATAVWRVCQVGDKVALVNTIDPDGGCVSLIVRREA